MPAWRARDKSLDLDRPRILAILNVTPDSFFDGGSIAGVPDAVERARRAVGAGADAIDIGGESTRPGAPRVDPEEQTRRVVPVIEAVRAALPSVIISVDTTRAAVAIAAIDAGADAVNDVSGAAEDDAMLAVCAEHGAGLILMHRLTTPDRDSYSDEYAHEPDYGDVVEVVRAYLSERAAAATGAGVAPESVLLDPGLGFGKSVADNLELIRRTGVFSRLGFGVVSGISRKSFVGRVSAPGGDDLGPAERLAGTLALSGLHLAAGARLFRVHDVPEHARALRAAWSVLGRAPG